jgi:SAM-dependent methyltransferase
VTIDSQGERTPVPSNDYLGLEAYLGGAFLHPGGQPATLVMIDRLGLFPGQRVLEIGCGTGATTALVARKTGVSLVSLDGASSMLTACANRLSAEGLRGGIDLLRVDLNGGLPFRDESFDAIFAESVIALLDDVAAVARECARLLRPGGRLAFNERIWKPGLSQAFVDEVNAYSQRAFGIASATRQPLDQRGWVALLEGAGLIAVQAMPVRELIDTRNIDADNRLRRRVRYLRRPSTIYPAFQFKRLASRKPAYWTQQENYLFFARKPEGGSTLVNPSNRESDASGGTR